GSHVRLAAAAVTAEMCVRHEHREADRLAAEAPREAADTTAAAVTELRVVDSADRTELLRDRSAPIGDLTGVLVAVERHPVERDDIVAACLDDRDRLPCGTGECFVRAA